MKRLNFVANPIFLLLIIASSVYVFFFYLADGPVRNKEAAEKEQELARQIAPANDPAATANVAGIVMKEENPFNLGKDPGQLNVPNGGQFFNQQNRQSPLAMQEENPFAQRTKKPRISRQPDPNVQAQPAQFQYQYGVPGRNIVPVAGGAMGKTWIEGHWAGLEAGPLTPAVAKANNIPPDVTGVLVDEVTLVAADSGLLAGDVITAINGAHVVDLQTFKSATKQAAQSNQANVTVYRRGAYKNIVLSGPDELGFAQIEGAPMILPTDRAPHGYYGPCDKCHTIASGATNTNQLARDLGDILTKSAPNIRKGVPAPHGNRGACAKCHVLL